MVAIALPKPRQLSFLDALPEVSAFDVLRLSWHIRRLHYTDALVSGRWRVERQRFQHIADAENDSAPDGTLVTASYAEYIVWHAGCIIGVVEVRTDDGARIVGIHDALARYLLKAGWRLDGTRVLEGSALASAGMRVDRIKRLLKGE